MVRQHFKNLFEYSAWADQTLGDLIVNSTSETANRRFRHIHSANIIWLSRILNLPIGVKVWDEEYPMDTILQEFKTVNRQYLDFINHCVDFDQKILYTNTKGEPFEQTIGEILTHVANHATYHRGQIAIDIKPFVDVIPATDYIFYLRSK